MPKLQKTGNSLMLVIPAEICKLKGWQKGDQIVVSLDSKTKDVVMSKIL